MKKLIIALLVVFLSGLSFAQKYQKCGTWRWAIKTLTDNMGEELLSKTPEPTTINALNELPRPGKVTSSTDRLPDERRVVSVKGFIIENKEVGGAKGDHDYHIVVQSEDGQAQLIAEIPSPDCPEVFANETMNQLFTGLRESYNEYIETPPGKIKALNPPVEVEITGIPFWDMVDHGGGHSANGIELHPVIDLKVINPPASAIAASPAAGTPFFRTVSYTRNLPPSGSDGKGAAATPFDILVTLVLGALLGMIGQGLRVWVGISKANADPANFNKKMDQYIETRRILFSFLYAFIIGALTGGTMAIGHIGERWDNSLIMAIITAGYAGTDFIEGFINKNLKGNPPIAAPAGNAIAGQK